MKKIEVCDILATNIEMMRRDEQFHLMEKASTADALHGLIMAKNEMDDEERNRHLETAIEIVLSYMFYIDLFAKKE